MVMLKMINLYFAKFTRELKFRINIIIVLLLVLILRILGRTH